MGISRAPTQTLVATAAVTQTTATNKHPAEDWSFCSQTVNNPQEVELHPGTTVQEGGDHHHHHHPSALSPRSFISYHMLFLQKMEVPLLPFTL